MRIPRNFVNEAVDRAAETKPGPSSPVNIEAACELLHDAYEIAAARSGWETQSASRKPWADVPEANKQTMRAAVTALLEWLNRT